MGFNTVNSKPMSTLILEHLQAGNDISPVEAAAMWRCRDLPKRISELIQAGHAIERVRRVDSTGQRYTRYRLRPAPVRFSEGRPGGLLG
jgi:transcriptional regulator NrdR family protein